MGKLRSSLEAALAEQRFTESHERRRTRLEGWEAWVMIRNNCVAVN